MNLTHRTLSFINSPLIKNHRTPRGDDARASYILSAIRPQMVDAQKATEPTKHACSKINSLVVVIAMTPNDPSSATRPTRGYDCNRSAMAGFAAAHG